MKVYYFTFGLVSISCYFLLVGNAYAENFQITIVNNTISHCKPFRSCYEPYEMNIATGDTITWINQDSQTHTVTTGASNNGQGGAFDSGEISPGHSFTQFFGIVGKYPYLDKTDGWLSGIITVSRGLSHPELQWVNGSLALARDIPTNTMIISKQIQNTGESDANSILFRLRILNQTGILLYDQVTTVNIPAKQSVPIDFMWKNPPIGNYHLNFEANAANTIGDTNANNDVATEVISIPNYTKVQQNFISDKNYTLPHEQVTVPEFGQMSYIVLAISILSIVILFSKPILRSKI